MSLLGQREAGRGRGKEEEREWGREGERNSVITIRDHWKAAERFFFLFKGQSNICACLKTGEAVSLQEERKYWRQNKGPQVLQRNDLGFCLWFWIQLHYSGPILLNFISNGYYFCSSCTNTHYCCPKALADMTYSPWCIQNLFITVSQKVKINSNAAIMFLSLSEVCSDRTWN